MFLVTVDRVRVCVFICLKRRGPYIFGAGVRWRHSSCMLRVWYKCAVFLCHTIYPFIQEFY